MRIWWTKKYQKSPQSNEFKGYTIFELLVEFFEDYYDQNPEKLRELDLPFLSTGDEFVDKWEKEISQGIVPDILEDLPPEEAEDLLKWSKSAYNKKLSGEFSFIGDQAEKASNFKEVNKETF